MPHASHFIAQKYQEFIRLQVEAHAGLPLPRFMDGGWSAYRLHPDLLPFLIQERQGVLDLLQCELERPDKSGEITHLFDTYTQAYIHQNNQFIAFSSTDRTRLAELYRRYLLGFTHLLAETDLSAADGPTRLERAVLNLVDEHFTWLQEFLDGLARRNGLDGERLLQQTAVCAHYPPELQLQVLALDPARLQEPILDLGCGPEGRLVQYLRALGREAYGLDRQVQVLPGLQAGDWLEVDFRPGAWGTILSHMAFSNHFIFHHLYRSGDPARYAHKYMEVLAALRLGGSFYYTPGLPFIEQFLPAGEYSVHRVELYAAQTLQAGLPPAALANLKGDIFYATRITRSG